MLGETCWMLHVWQEFCELLAGDWKWSPYYRWSKPGISLEESYLFWGSQRNWNNNKCAVEDCFLRLVSLMFLFLINNYINESTGRYSSRKTSLFLGRATGYLSQVGLSKQSSKRPQNRSCQFQMLLIKTNKQKQACLGWVWKCPQGAEG